MGEQYYILLPILFPILCGLMVLVFPKWDQRIKALHVFTGVVLMLTGVLVVGLMCREVPGCSPFALTQALAISFRADGLGRFFAFVFSIVWILAGFFSFKYMKHEGEERRYFGFYLCVYGILLGLAFAENLVTYYAFYELMTLVSMPMVLHSRTHASIMAGLKYLFYSFCGAYLVLFGFYFVCRHGNTISFTAGGVFTPEVLAGHQGLLLLTAFLMILGFGVKGGLFPMHGWLPTAHPVAPAPASAVLSGIIVKAGVLGIIRTVYYIYGADFLRGTWVQFTWIGLTLFTVFMGSMLAYREKVLKKRLAYSTVSQVSYILFGLALLEPVAMTGALLHVAAHAFIKSALFLSAGAIIFLTGRTRTDQLTGIGKRMPVTLWCYTFVSLGLIGIPPTAGFLSKWYLCIGSLNTGIPVINWFGPMVLMVSALLTAGYLLPITVGGFLPGKAPDQVPELPEKEPLIMTIPLIVLTILVLGVGLFPSQLMQMLTVIVGSLNL